MCRAVITRYRESWCTTRWRPSSRKPANPANFLQHGYTYGGTPLGAATALAAIDYLEKEDIPAGVPPKAAQLRSGLENLATSHSVIGEVRGNGLLLALELVADPATGSRFADPDGVGRFMIAEGLRQGLLMIVNGTTVNIMPALTISSDEIIALIGRSERVARALSQLGHHTLHGGPVDSIEPFGSRPAVLEPHRRDQQPECGGDSRSGGITTCLARRTLATRPATAGPAPPNACIFHPGGSCATDGASTTAVLDPSFNNS